MSPAHLNLKGKTIPAEPLVLAVAEMMDKYLAREQMAHQEEREWRDDDVEVMLNWMHWGGEGFRTGLFRVGKTNQPRNDAYPQSLVTLKRGTL